MVDDATGEPSGGPRKPSYHPLQGWSATCSISKLPLELISHIIALSLPGTSRVRERLKALYATRMVSRVWRNVIDSTPSLWNVVSSNLPLHINSTTIRRSSRFPLDIYLAEIGPLSRRAERSGFAELATKEIGRWSKANLKLPFPGGYSSHLNSPAPLLRNLSVKYRRRNSSTKPVVLFGGIAPRLEVLKVDGVRMDWTASFIHGLRELNLSNMIDGEISTQQVLDILAITPLLEELRIFNSILEHRHQHPPAPPSIIHLPNMKAISLSEINGEAAGAILSYIRASNCTLLNVRLALEDERDGPNSFPEPALSHFKDLQRRTILANHNSKIGFFDRSMEWYSPSKGVDGAGFSLLIRYGAAVTGVEWATGIIGIGAQELVHDLEVTICHARFTEDHFAVYHPISRWQSVTKLTVDYDYPIPRPILDLLGSWQDLEDGTKPLPGFPQLEDLVLISSQAVWLDDLEVLVNRRFGGRDDVIGEQVQSLDIVLDMWGSCSDPDSRVDLARLQRLRAANGVRGITRLLDEHLPGMLAAVYDDDAGP